MTIIVRRIGDRKHYRKLGKAGECMVGLAELVGAFGSGKIVRVVWLS
jgi:hypothetical protein